MNSRAITEPFHRRELVVVAGLLEFATAWKYDDPPPCLEGVHNGSDPRVRHDESTLVHGGSEISRGEEPLVTHMPRNVGPVADLREALVLPAVSDEIDSADESVEWCLMTHCHEDHSTAPSHSTPSLVATSGHWDRVSCAWPAIRLPESESSSAFAMESTQHPGIPSSLPSLMAK